MNAHALLMTYVFLPPDKRAYYGGNSQVHPPSTQSLDGAEESPDQTLYEPIDIPEPSEKDIESARSYRTTPTQIEALKRVLSQYEGTKNFFNFTIGKGPRDRSCRRYIIKADVSDPFVEQGIEWIKLSFHGQSFMLHQIRKMVGKYAITGAIPSSSRLAILIVRTQTPPEVVEKLCSEGPKPNSTSESKAVRVNVPKAPGFGLLLDDLLFDGYNMNSGRRIESGKERIDFAPYQDEIEEFKRSRIYQDIFKEEFNTNSFWYMNFLNKEGNVWEQNVRCTPKHQQAGPADAMSDGEEEKEIQAQNREDDS
ncbi:tRNA pseudouridine synthase 1 [Quaeritorhiza haematococci]|nr:tRNA pseudouridine synthase 1 [Quaeritorhiza haematococci]